MAAAAVTGADWYNPIVQFLFFAVGALLALLLHGRKFTIPAILRVAAPVITVLCWVSAKAGWLVSLGTMGLILTQLLIALGCVLLFFALYGISATSLPAPLVYLGRRSYGLYVFHPVCYGLVSRFVTPNLPGSEHRPVEILWKFAFTLVLTAAVAAISFRFFELPFLHLKQKKFTFVRSGL